jgi:hypothetical protein
VREFRVKGFELNGEGWMLRVEDWGLGIEA